MQHIVMQKAFGSQVWNESLHIYSALRNAAEDEIAIIYDAEIWLQVQALYLLNCRLEAPLRNKKILQSW